jgi:hypothetical protein
MYPMYHYLQLFPIFESFLHSALTFWKRLSLRSLLSEFVYFLSISSAQIGSTTLAFALCASQTHPVLKTTTPATTTLLHNATSHRLQNVLYIHSHTRTPNNPHFLRRSHWRFKLLHPRHLLQWPHQRHGDLLRPRLIIQRPVRQRMLPILRHRQPGLCIWLLNEHTWGVREGHTEL